jgi:hypothetical protein
VNPAGPHRRPPAPLAWRLWYGLRRALAAAWPGWSNALGLAWLVYMVLVILGWLP